MKSELAVLFRELGILGPAVEETHVNAEAGVTGDRSKHTKERCSRTENQRVTDILDGSESERSEDRINDGVVTVIEVFVFPCYETQNKIFSKFFSGTYDKYGEKDCFNDRIIRHNKIKDEVISNKDKYRSYVLRLQELITVLTDKGVQIQTGEERNRQIIDSIFLKTRQEIKKQRTGLNVASTYYRTMSNSVVRAAETSILDEKK